MRKRGFGQIKHREDVGAEGTFELLTRDLVDAVLWVLLGGIIDQYVEPAEVVHGLLHRLPTKHLIAYIPNQVKTPLASSFDLVFGLIRIAMLTQIDNSYIRTLPGKRDCDRTAYTAV